MSSSLKKLFDSLLLAPELAGVTQEFGEDRVFFNEETPRVVWVPPDRESFVEPDGYTADPLNNPRIVWHRVVNALVYCHASSNLGAAAEPDDHTEAAECLAQRVIQALHGQMFTGYRYVPIELTWLKNEGETLKYGRVAVLLIEFRFAVTLPKSQEVAVDDTPFTIQVDPIIVPGGP